MMKKRKQHEDYETSCRVLLDRIPKEERDEVRYMLMEDLTDKAYRMIERAPLPSTGRRKSFDIAIVAIIESELRAVKLAFGINPKAVEDDNVNGLRYWYTTVKRKSPPKEFSVLITMVGEARNVLNCTP